MKIVAVVGSRTKTKEKHEHVRSLVGSRMKAYGPDTVFLSGGCSNGADYWCRYFCGLWNRKYLEAPALWSGVLGKAAGPERNRLIADICTEMLVFWDGQSPGTRGTIDYMKCLPKKYEVIPL